MTFEWKIAVSANSGVKYRFGDYGGKQIGPEYQLLDDAKWKYSADSKNSTASLYDVIPPAADKKTKPVGEWNASRIVAKGSAIEHFLNGELAMKTDLSGDEFKAALAKEQIQRAARLRDQGGAHHAARPRRRSVVPPHQNPPAVAIAMPDANVWEDRYQRGENQWEKGAPHPALAAYLRDHAMPGRVLVPGCGFGHDVRLLADAGAEALGLDIAPSAVSHAQALGANVRLGDFFHLDPALCGSFDGVFEHTCFCAIDRDRRDGYVEAAKPRTLKPGGKLLAIFYLRPGGIPAKTKTVAPRLHRRGTARPVQRHLRISARVGARSNLPDAIAASRGKEYVM
ncbi:MAG: family 16 glycoside hydrolase [Verrucomicrobiales bacterium]